MRISAARKTISARRGAGTSRHLVKARLAASTAASTSALADFWKMPTTSRVSAGLRFSKVSPVEDSTHSPSMKFLRIFVGLWLPRVAGGGGGGGGAVFSFLFSKNFFLTGGGGGGRGA